MTKKQTTIELGGGGTLLNRSTQGFTGFVRRKKVAFTLAEVLITLAIIGVVAALTLTNLTKAYQKRVTVTRLQNVYSTLSQALETARAEYGDAEKWDYTLSGKAFFDRYFASLKKESEAEFGAVMPNYKTMNSAAKIEPFTFHKHRTNSTVITLSNGSWVSYYNTLYNPDYPTSQYIYIMIDINGAKNPNILGIDLFPMGILRNGKLFFASGGATNRANLMINDDIYSCKYSGYDCGRIIFMDGWHISKDYPWK